MTESSETARISGWLWIWSNDVQRYEKSWFVLSCGTLAHYANQEETACKGMISLAGAIIDFDETCKFVICQGEAYHVKADNQEEKRKWVEALLAAADVDRPPATSGRNETDYGEQLEESQTLPLMCSVSHCIQPGRAQCDQPIDTSTDERDPAQPDGASTENVLQNQEKHHYRVKTADGAAYVMPAASTEQKRCSKGDKNELSAAFHEPQFARLISIMKQNFQHIRTCNKLVNQHNLDLQRLIGSVTEHCQGEQMFQRVSEKAAEYQASASEMTEACTSYMNLVESYCRSCIIQCDQIKTEQIVKSLTQAQSKLSESVPEEDEFEYFDSSETANSLEKNYAEVRLQVYQAVAGAPRGSSRRNRVPDRPNVSDSLWSVLKNCIGNDLSKMPLPVSFGEPLSLLQRLTEDFEYANVLDIASECKDVATQLAYVAAFIASSYSTTVGRSGKPFNPLLGETYECDRMSDLGWRSIAEQVSHHPPMAAIYGEGKNWEFWMDQSMKSKFKGATLTVVPLGECHLNFKNGNRYSWHKPNTSIHNVIVGKLWVEQEGDVDIKCATSNVTCKLTFISSGWTGENFSLKGTIKDGSGKAVFDIVGKYSTQIEYRPAGSKDQGTVVWKRTEPPADNAKYYNFTLLACQLNEMEDGIAPTDSRLRPDQRLMEEGNFDAANVMKRKLEEFQRANKKETWTPSWFKRQADPDTKTELWTYGGEYWPCKAKKDWSRCPSHIFSPP